MSNRDAQHTKQPPTKEIFAPFTTYTNATYSAVGGFGGILINANAEYTYCNIKLPWDFNRIVDAKVVFIAAATATPMTFRIVTNWCKAEALYSQANNLQAKSVNVIANYVHEVDMSQALITLGGNTRIAALDYLGVQVSSQAGPPAQNTNAIFLGVKIRYK